MLLNMVLMFGIIMSRMILILIIFFRYTNYYKKSKIDLSLLEAVKLNTLLNLSIVDIRKKNYRTSIEFSKQVSYKMFFNN